MVHWMEKSRQQPASSYSSPASRPPTSRLSRLSIILPAARCTPPSHKLTSNCPGGGGRKTHPLGSRPGNGFVSPAANHRAAPPTPRAPPGPGMRRPVSSRGPTLVGAARCRDTRRHCGGTGLLCNTTEGIDECHVGQPETRRRSGISPETDRHEAWCSRYLYVHTLVHTILCI